MAVGAAQKKASAAQEKAMKLRLEKHERDLAKRKKEHEEGQKRADELNAEFAKVMKKYMKGAQVGYFVYAAVGPKGFIKGHNVVCKKSNQNAAITATLIRAVARFAKNAKRAEQQY